LVTIWLIYRQTYSVVFMSHSIDYLDGGTAVELSPAETSED